jgi:hypothetical protein
MQLNVNQMHLDLVIQLLAGSSLSRATVFQELGHGGNWYNRIHINMQDLLGQQLAGSSCSGATELAFPNPEPLQSLELPACPHVVARSHMWLHAYTES